MSRPGEKQQVSIPPWLLWPVAYYIGRIVMFIVRALLRDEKLKRPLVLDWERCRLMY